MRCLGSDNIKSRCLSAFLIGINYINKIMYV